jgi:chromosomal replication initiator protein
LEIIKDNLSEKAYCTWFRPIVPIKYEGDDFTIQVPSHFFYEYIEEQYAHLIHATLMRVTGKNVIINYRVFVDNSDEKKGHTTIPSDKTVNEGIDGKKPASGLNKSPDPLVLPQEWNSHLNERLSFRNFFEGPSNILARRVGETVAEQPGKSFNPLYVYGCTGVGKTHLCHAIGNRIRELSPDKKVIYISSHLFQVQFTDASRNNTFNDFINFYQNVDALIIDDIQEFIGKEKTQNAYFHIFNHLHLLGKQLVLTSDKAPNEMQGLEERMITRMKWGMTAELHKPDLELRKKILHYKVKQDGLNLPDEIIDYIAENVTDHVRDLEGIVTSLVAHALVYNKEIDWELTRQVVSKFVKHENKIITPEKIQNTVSSYFNIDLKDIHSKSRKQEIVKARQVAMFLCKKHTNYSFAHIGNIVGKRDHATVLHACTQIQNQIDVNKSFRTVMNEIEVLLKK